MSDRRRTRAAFYRKTHPAAWQGEKGFCAARLVSNTTLRQRCFARAGPTLCIRIFFNLLARLLLADLKNIYYALTILSNNTKHVDRLHKPGNIVGLNGLHCPSWSATLLVPTGKVKYEETLSCGARSGHSRHEQWNMAKLGNFTSALSSATEEPRVGSGSASWPCHGLVLPGCTGALFGSSTPSVMMVLCWPACRWRWAWAVWRTPFSSSLWLLHPTSSPLQFLPDSRG